MIYFQIPLSCCMISLYHEAGLIFIIVCSSQQSQLAHATLSMTCSTLKGYRSLYKHHPPNILPETTLSLLEMYLLQLLKFPDELQLPYITVLEQRFSALSTKHRNIDLTNVYQAPTVCKVLVQVPEIQY